MIHCIYIEKIDHAGNHKYHGPMSSAHFMSTGLYYHISTYRFIMHVRKECHRIKMYRTRIAIKNHLS